MSEEKDRSCCEFHKHQDEKRRLEQENKELRTRVAELEAEAKMGNIPYKEAVKLRTRVAELEQRMIDQADMICKKSNEADMERRTAEMHCADAVKLSKRVEELENENENILKDFEELRMKSLANEELQTRLSTLEKELSDAHVYLDEATAVYKDKKFPLIERIHCLNQSFGQEELDNLQTRLSTLMKASERMEMALGMVIKANHVDVRKPSEECMKEHFVILLPTEDDEDIKQILADFRAVKKSTTDENWNGEIVFP